MLKISNVEVTYVDVILVLRGVSLQVEDGSIVALLGANGAGKSTTLKGVSGLLHTEDGEVTRGTIEFDGHRIDRLNPEQTAKMGIIQVVEGRQLLEHLTVEENLHVGGYVFQGIGLFPHLTVEENLHGGGSVYKGGSKMRLDLDMVYDYFP